MSDFTMEKDADGVAIITWDCPGKTMNVLNGQAMQDLDGLIDDALADEAVKGIVSLLARRTLPVAWTSTCWRR